MSSGSIDKAKGKIKKKVGQAVNDPELQDEGAIDEASGAVKDAGERGVNAVRDALKGKRRR